MGALVGTAIFIIALVAVTTVVEGLIGLGYIRALNDKMEGKWDNEDV